VSNYIAFLHGGIEKAGEKPLEDGNALANQCLDKLREIDNPEQFPPKLLFLLISAKYLDGEDYLDEIRARQLIAGVRQSFFEAGHRDIPLIGSSVAAVFYDRQIYHDGVLLVCLASRLLDVTVSVATNVSSDPDTAVNKLIDGLDIEHALDEYPRSLPNRTLLTIFPGTGTIGLTARNSTDKLHTLLLEKLTYQIPIVGGVSSANDQKRNKYGLQLVNQQTFTDALAACLIRSGLPLATSMAKGLEPTKEILQVEKLSADERFIETFDNGRRPEEIFKDRTKPILLRDYSSESDVVRAKWLPNSNPGEVIILRDVRPYSALEVTTPNPKRMYKESLAAHELSFRRAKIKNPGGCLSFMCSGHLSYRNELGLDLPSGIKAMQETFGIPHYVGGFYEGEISTDATGAFTCGGWSFASLIFGDELSERTAVQGGFSTLATHGLALTATFELKEALKRSLELVYDLGFPGAMLSLKMRDHNPDLLPNQSKGILVPVSAKGTRFNKVLQLMKQEVIDGEMPPEVGVGDKPVFISHPPPPPGSGRDVFWEAGIVNEYVLPLHDSGNQVFALLRVDVGTQEEPEIHEAVKGVLNSISAIVGAAINRIFNWQENRIARELDQILKKSISANTRREGLQHFIQGALKAFGLSMGHIRLVNPEKHCLMLEAGEGAYFEAANASRSQVSFEDWSPSCEAFIRETMTIINDAPNNIAHKRMRDKYVKDPRMTGALRSLGSYANIPFKSENGERLGTINLLSNKRWFFNSYHERALAALSRRVGFLLEHLTSKEEMRDVKQQAEEIAQTAYKLQLRIRALDGQLQFIQNVGKTLELVSGVDDLIINVDKTLDLVSGTDPVTNDISNALTFATQHFCAELGASSAALYLWDEDQQQYILRAQFGWKDERWVHAARYRRTDNWIGTKGLADRPRYVQDLFQYYQDQNYSEPSGRYAVHIFGKPLSENFTVEAIASPLRLAGGQIGVLTLYGKPGAQSTLKFKQFQTTDVSVLEEVISRFAGQVGVLMASQRASEEKRALLRRTGLFDSFAHQDRKESFETNVCGCIARLFGVNRVEFFSAKGSGEVKDLVWAHGVEISPTDGQSTSLTTKPADEFVKQSVRTELVQIMRKKAVPTDSINPDLAVIEGMIERSVIPLIGRGKLSGVIDLYWDAKRLADLAAFNFFNVSELEELGRMLGALYTKHRMILELDEAKKREEESQQTADSLDGLFALCEHKISHLLNWLGNKAEHILHATSEEDLTAEISSLPVLIKKDLRWLNKLVAAAKEPRGEKRRIRLGTVIESALDESGIKDRAQNVARVLEVPEALSICANEDAVREALVNVIVNAFEAMPSGGVLTITASRSFRDGSAVTGDKAEREDADYVKIGFDDDGVGMTEKQFENLGKVNTTKTDHDGLGIALSMAAIQRQGGTFKVIRKNGKGMLVEIILPSRRMEV
jgi:signal transduction histidine kinase